MNFAPHISVFVGDREITEIARVEVNKGFSEAARVLITSRGQG